VTRIGTLLWITFIESFATILVERGVYFYTRGVLGYSDVHNLWIALGLGLAYIVGASVSHPLAARLGERRLARVSVAGQLAAHLCLLAVPRGPVLVSGVVAVGLFNGLKWPVIESYIGAGRSPRLASRAIGRFNLAWSSAVPLSLAAAGPMIAWRPVSLFIVAAAVNLVSLWALGRVPATPTHLPHDHPDRPDDRTLSRYRTLMASSRWSMLSSYSLLFLLSPLMPGVFARLQVPLVLATGLAALLDVMRVVTFFFLGRWSGWHDKVTPLALVLVALPAGFAASLFGTSVTVVLVGEILFGLAIGMSYYAALYYAMVVKNASVDAGGVHEGLIGAGFTFGPLVGLAGLGLAGPLGGPVAGLVAGVLPLALACAVGAALPLVRRRPRG
jgi:MFS family permease